MCGCLSDPFECYRINHDRLDGYCCCACHKDWKEPKMTKEEEPSMDAQHWVVMSEQQHAYFDRLLGRGQACNRAEQKCKDNKLRYYILHVIGYVDPVEPQPPTKKVMHAQ